MRLFSFLASAVLPLLALAAKQSTSDRFAENSSKSYPLKLDDQKLSKLTNAPRDYASAVLLTALDAKFGCSACQEFQPEWLLVSKSWQNGDKAGNTRTVFATLDFEDGRATFQALGLQHAPVLLLFLPTTGPNARADSSPIQFDFVAGPQNADSIHAWIARHLPDTTAPPLVRPFNYIRFVSMTTAALGLITLGTVAMPYVLPIIQNRNLWAGVSLISVLLFTSGHMFNHIRKVPYVSGDGKGGIAYFAGGFQNQFGLETQIIAGIYGILAFATITLAVKVPRIADPKTQQVAVLVWGGVTFVVYSFLLSVFKVKNGSYPFWLPPF